MGVFENREKPKYVTCVAFNQSGDVITGKFIDILTFFQYETYARLIKEAIFVTKLDLNSQKNNVLFLAIYFVC